MQTLLQQVEETIAYIGSKTVYRPETAIVLGSGLGQLADKLEEVCSIAYEELPHWKSSTAPGHNGRLLFGRLGGKPVVCMQGRLHYMKATAWRDYLSGAGDGAAGREKSAAFQRRWRHQSGLCSWRLNADHRPYQFYGLQSVDGA